MANNIDFKVKNGIVVSGDIQQQNAQYIKGKLANGTATRLFGLSGTNTFYVGGVDAATLDMLFVNNGAELMRITPAGNVGIGTGSPASRLEVSGTAAITRVSGTAGSSPRLELSSAGVVNWGIRSNHSSASELTIFQDATERLRIDSSGNTGIGGTPVNRLDVYHAVNGIGARLRNTSTSVEIALRTDATTAGFDAGNATGGMTFSSNTTERMRLTPAGELCVGTTSALNSGTLTVNAPTAKNAITAKVTSAGYSVFQGFDASSNNVFEVQSSGQTTIANNAFILFRETNGTGRRVAGMSPSSTLYYGDVDNAIAGGQLIMAANSIQAWYVNAAERMRLDSSATLMINRTSSSGLGQLQVAISSGSSIADFSASSGSAAVVRVRATTLDSAYTFYQNSGTGTSLSDGLQVGIDSTSKAYFANNEAGAISFQTSAVERMSISAAGVIADGAGRELGLKDVPISSNAWVRGLCNVVTADTSINVATVAGEVYSIFNDSGATIVLSPGAGLTMRLGGTTATGARSILPYGYATIWFRATNVCVVNGNVT